MNIDMKKTSEGAKQSGETRNHRRYICTTNRIFLETLIVAYPVKILSAL
jgi:hypothetical protein